MSLDFGKLNFSVSFNPTSAFPLDARSYFESYDAAVAAAATAGPAGSDTTTYYFGETISVVENGEAKLYTIQPDGTLTEIGAAGINENVFVKDAAGNLDLFGFADAVAGAQLLKGADGKLSWVKPDQTTVEGLQTEVGALRSDIDTARTDLDEVMADAETLKTDVGTLKTDVETLQGDVDAVEEEVAKKANAADVYTKDETDTAISEAIAAVDHLERTKVDNVEAIDPAAENAERFIYMVPVTGEEGNYFEEYMVIDGKVERVGDWGVDLTDYITTEALQEELDKKVDIVDGERLMTDAEGTKLEGIEAGAQVNVIDSVDTEELAIDGDKKLSIVKVGVDKVEGLDDELAKKVDVVEGERLMTDAEGEKLEGIEAGAQVNVIEKVTSELSISEDKTLGVVSIAMDKVEGLPAALADKVSNVDGKGLSTNDLTDELVEKINSSDANVIEIIRFNNVELAIAEDKSVDINIPVAGAELGLVKSSDEENKVSVDAEGKMEVNSLNVNKLVQTEGEYLILNGGASAL